MSMAASVPTARSMRPCWGAWTGTNPPRPRLKSRTASFRRNRACRRSRSRPSSARGSSPQRLVDGRLYHRSIKLDGLHDLGVRQGADAELQAEAVMAEPFVLGQDLVD